MPSLNRKFHVHQLEPGLLGQGLSQLANFFSHFQFGSRRGQKTEWSHLPHS